MRVWLCWGHIILGKTLLEVGLTCLEIGLDPIFVANDGILIDISNFLSSHVVLGGVLVNLRWRICKPMRHLIIVLSNWCYILRA